MNSYRLIIAILLFMGLVGITSEDVLAADKEKTLSGTFQGIEQGDYFHWKMTDKKGNEHSFFILATDGSIDAVVDAPEKFVGKACSVKWKSSNVEIPEAGGKMDIDQILSVTWDPQS